jgi:hypothetical protein
MANELHTLSIAGVNYPIQPLSFKVTSNTITTTANDTTANWGGLGCTAHYYTTAGQLTGQPSQYGFLANYSSGSEVHQLWMTQASGSMYHRGGNYNGWSGGWRTLIDDSNYSTWFYNKTDTDSRINTAIANLVNSAPDTLNTLKELSDALGADPNFATTITNHLANKANKDGSNATGTWPINITGHADTAGSSTYAARLGDSSSYYTKLSLDTALAGKAPTHDHPYFPITGGSLSGDNRTIGSTMGGGTDSWSIGGYGTGDTGECRITIKDNSNDKFAIQIEDYTGTIYRPLIVESENVIGTKFTGPLAGNADTATNADTVDNLHASDFFRAYGTQDSGNSYDSDWGQSVVTFDPVANGTYPEKNPNVTILNLGNNYARRKQLSFNYNNNNIYFRRKIDNAWQPWVRLALA